MDISTIASKIDQLGEAQTSFMKTQAVLENEIKTMSKTMERFADILSKQIEHDTILKEARADINTCFDHIRDIQTQGTNVCSNHNAQFAEYHARCDAKGEELDKEIKDIYEKIRVRDNRFMKIAGVISTPIYLYIITKILNL